MNLLKVSVKNCKIINTFSKKKFFLLDTNGNTDDESSEMSAAIESSRDSGRINCVDEESQDQSSKSSGDTQCNLFWLMIHDFIEATYIFC